MRSRNGQLLEVVDDLLIDDEQLDSVLTTDQSEQVPITVRDYISFIGLDETKRSFGLDVYRANSETDS